MILRRCRLFKLITDIEDQDCDGTTLNYSLKLTSTVDVDGEESNTLSMSSGRVGDQTISNLCKQEGSGRNQDETLPSMTLFC